ncbi:hypothetical protein N9V68_00425 [Octadecabacter sp.]|nr:hypothetical protein [Octadecabacter sp.]
MTKRGSMVPIALVVTIAVLAFFAIGTGRSNAPDVTVDANYPHYVCTFNSYCAGAACTRTPFSIVAYLSHENDQPRLDMPGVASAASLEQRDGLTIFTTASDPDQISGTLVINSNRNMDWEGTSGEAGDLVEHFGTGRCERLKTP